MSGPRTETYRSTPSGPLQVDIYEPPARSNDRLPAVLFFHGGGWCGGDRTLGMQGLRAVADTGRYVLLTFDYRLSPQAAWPAQLEDARAAVRWAMQHATRLGVDAGSIALAGASAGGQLAMMAAFTADLPDVVPGAGRPFSPVRAVLSFAGPVDLTNRAPFGSAAAEAVRELFGRIDDASALHRLAQSASPIEHLSEHAPPLLLVHGTADQTVPITHAEAMAVRAEATGAAVEVVRVEGGGHGVIADTTVSHAVAVLDRLLHAESADAPDAPARSKSILPEHQPAHADV